MNLFRFLCFQLLLCQSVLSIKGLVEYIDDLKEWKKLLRTRNNVLGVFYSKDSQLKDIKELLDSIADEMRGKAVLCTINCGQDKKLCKKLKVSTDQLSLKHYKDGEFNKDYDRPMVKKSMLRFLESPTGDAPWDEDNTAQDVLHIQTANDFLKFQKKVKKPSLVMFYAPWCGYCKQLKPDFAAAATELKKDYVLAGMDVDTVEGAGVRASFNITGFPTLYYFEDGEPLYQYSGKNTKDDIISWMKDPQPPAPEEPPKQEVPWSEEENEVAHLTDETFDEFVAENPSVLVMFYAPWCGHCKAMKPAYTEAAEELKDLEIQGKLAAINAQDHKEVAQKFGVKSYPRVKYFKDGEFSFDYKYARTKEMLVEFMKAPQPPEPEIPWTEQESDVVHLTDETFQTFLKKKKHSLVMFYAPWCGHCKKAKPGFTEAASLLKENGKVAIAAVDCTVNEQACKTHQVSGYPTFLYFNYGKDQEIYAGKRESASYIEFLEDPSNKAFIKPPPPPPQPKHYWDDPGYPKPDSLNILTSDNFDSFLNKNPKAVILFHSPSCTKPSCTGMKTIMKTALMSVVQLIEKGVVKDAATAGAVDVDLDPALASKFEIADPPIVMYFENGEQKRSFNSTEVDTSRDLDQIIRNPKTFQPKVKVKRPEPVPWENTAKTIKHLTDKDYKSFLEEHEHVLVMLYAPKCGFCQMAKPEYELAADIVVTISERKKEDRTLAAFNCAQNEENRKICKDEGVAGFPTFFYYNYGKNVGKYDGERKLHAFVKYITDPPVPAKVEEQAKEEVKNTEL